MASCKCRSSEVFGVKLGASGDIEVDDTDASGAAGAAMITGDTGDICGSVGSAGLVSGDAGAELDASGDKAEAVAGVLRRLVLFGVELTHCLLAGALLCFIVSEDLFLQL